MRLNLDEQLRHVLIALDDGDPERPLVRWDVEPLGVLEVVPRSADYLAVEVRSLRSGVARICAVLLDRDARRERSRSSHHVRVADDGSIATAPISASMSIQEDPEQGGVVGG